MKNIYRNFIFILLLLCFIPFKGFSSHIVGGALTYTYNGGNNYTVKLLLYRDCSGAAFPANAVVSVFSADGSLFAPDRTFTLPAGAITNIPPVLPPCATTPSVVPCVEQRVYTTTVNLAPSPGGMHLVYSVCCRNPAISNIASPGTTGETFYAFIPCYLNLWAEDFTLANGTTSDAGATAWTRTLGLTPPTSAQVNNGAFEVVGSNNGSQMWASQVINIAAYPLGVNMSANISKAGTNFGNNDTLRLYYSLNGGPLTVWTTNGSNTGNWASPRFATQNGLIGNTIQIYLRTKFNANNNSTGKTFFADMISVYDNTFLPNSNPEFSALPPLLLCATNSFTLNQAATDLDGDVLVYSMYDPYNDLPAPTFPNNIFTVNTITWTAGYSATSPFNSGGPSVTLNPGTGIMTGVANTLGQYVFGVKCQEYRGGVLLSEMVRDYQVKTVTCPPFVPAAPVASANTPLCVGQTLNLSATFTAGAIYNWTGPNGFSSTSINPSITNVTALAAGIYSVTATVSGCTSPPGTVQVVVNPTPASPTAGSNSPLCAGQTLNLTASVIAGATYNWSGPNSFTASTQNPTLAGATVLAAGVYSVTATVTGCTGSAGTANVVVNPVPGAPTAGSNAPICAGQNLNLTASTIGGATYSWTGPNSFTSTTQNPTIAGATTLASGTYSVSAVVGGCASSAGTTNVTVSPAPAAPVAGSNAPICAGQTLNLTASTIAGATYNWSGPNSFSSSTQNPNIPAVTVLGAGVYSVNAIVGGCPGPNGTVNVVINPSPVAPTAGGTATLCAGSTINLTASAIGGATYNWTGPNSFTSNIQNPTIPGASTLATGMYSVTATVAGCPGPAGTFSVSVFGIPAPPTLGSNSPVCVGQTLNLTASNILGATYSWSGPNSFSSSSQNPSIPGVTALEAGTYSVLVSVSGCGSANSTIAVVINPTPASPTAGSNSPLCAGQTINLTASTIGGATYSWNGPNSFTSTTQNPTIPGASTLTAGTYSVVSIVGGCPSAPGTVNVTVNPIPGSPVAGSNSPVCIGSPLNLTASTIAGATYTWSGPAGFSSNTQNPTIASATAINSGTYTVLVSVAGCNGPASTTTVLVSPIPTAPTAGNNSPICEFQTLNLTANTIAGATYNWSGPNSFTSTAQNPTIPGATTLAAGVYSVTATVGGCPSPAGTTTVLINVAPAAPTAGSNSPLCIGMTINLTASTIGGATYNWTGPNSYTSTTQNPTIVGASTVATGVYSVTATLGGCTSLSGTVSVLMSAPAIVNAGVNQTVCANNSTIALNGTSTTGSGTWSTGGTGSFSPNTLTGIYVPTPADIASAPFTLTLTSTNNGGCPAVSNTMTVSVSPAPTANAGPNQAICANNSTLTLSGSFGVASGGIWSSSGTGTFSPNNTNMNANYIPSPADILAGSVIFTLTTTGNGNCLPVTDTTMIIFYPGPTVSGGPNKQYVCKNNPNYPLNATSSTGSVTWATLGSGAFTPTNNILNPTYIPSTADTTSGSVFLIITTTNNGSCNQVRDTIQLIYTSTITINAGATQTVCANNSTVALTGTCTTGFGTWSSSGSGSFSPNTLTGNYIPSPADISSGMVTLTVTSGNNGTCLPITSTVNIFFTPAPTSSANIDQTVCANNATVALSGSFTLASGGIWSSSGTGTFSPNNTNMNANYIPSPADTTAGSVSIILSTTGNGNCLAVKDTMKIFFTPAPLVNAGANIAVCRNNPVVSLNGYCSTGTATWTTLGSGSFAPSTSVFNPTYTPSTADTTAGSVFLLFTSTNNAGCNPVTDTIKITYSSIPTVSAGISQTVCANNSTIALNGLSSTGSGTWTASGTGTFAPNTYTGNYIPSAADIGSGSVTFTITSTNNGGCLAVSSTISMAISPAPTSSAGSDQIVCANNASVALTGSFSIASGGAWSSSGTGTFVPNTTNMNTGYVPSQADTAAGFINIFLTTTGNGNCKAVKDTMKLTFNHAPIVNAGSNIVVCNNTSVFNLNGISSTGSGTWTTMGSGAFTPSISVLNPTYTASAGDMAAGNVNLILTSTNNGACNALKDTVNISFQSQPVANFFAANKCLNVATTFTDASTVATGTIISWNWNFGASTSTVQNASNTFTSTGSQTVSLVVSNGGCKDSIAKIIYINPVPTVTLIATPLCHDSAQFTSSSTISSGNITIWNWNFGDAGTSAQQNPYHVYADTGSYVINLSIISDSGCVASAADTIHIVPCGDSLIISNPAVPGGFTPNGDGKNDVLYVKGGPFNKMNFRLFNEWGNQIFSADVQSTGWDGTYKNAVQPGGRYIWTLTGEVKDGRQVNMAGEVILSR